MATKKKDRRKPVGTTSVRLNREVEKHNRIKRLNGKLVSLGEDLTIEETYDKVIEAGAAVLEQA